MTKIQKILLGAFVIALSFGLGYFATPNKIVTKEVVKTQVVKEEAKTKIVYREKVTSTDGTITEKQVEREDTKTTEVAKSETTSDKSVQKDSGLTISALVLAPVRKIKEDQEYAVVVSKRVIGALNVTVSADTSKRVGVGLGWSF